MFDTMTLTKIVGAFCGALLVLLLGKWVAESVYAMGGGHGDDHAQAYVIETGDEEGGDAAAEEGPDLATLYAEADEGKGAKVFGKCKACHKLEEGANSTGPYLYGVVGREVGSVADFGYSGALVAVADVWGVEELDGFLENPKGYAPGTKMAFSGLSKPEDRANLILYLDLLDGDRVELAAADPAEEPAAEEAASEDAATEEAATEQAATEEPAAEEAATEEAAAEEAATEEAAAEEAATEEPAAEEAATEEAAAEEAATEEPAAEEAATEEPAAEEAATEEPAAEEAATEEPAAEEAATEEPAAEEAATEEPAAEEAATEEPSAEEAATEEPAAEEAATEEPAAEEEADAGASGFAAMVAAADPAAGKKVFNKCKACHKLEDGKNGVGPHLYGVVGREVDAVEGFRYSGKLEEAADVWTPENLSAFLENPREFAPGTKMAFAGLKDEEDRANVIAYLQSVAD